MDLFADENVPSPMLVRDRHVRNSSWRRRRAGCHQSTADRDFGELTFHRGLPVVGVVLLQLERLSLPAQVERVATFLVAERANLTGSFTVLEPANVRRRVL
jgi:hypothetical protein